MSEKERAVQLLIYAYSYGAIQWLGAQTQKQHFSNMNGCINYLGIL